jgi:hypothetical protein
MTSYWISDICILFNSFEINPFVGPDKNFKYNALTRLIILITLISAIFFDNYKDIGLAGLISLMLSVIIYFVTFNKDMNYKKPNPLDSVEQNDNKVSSNYEKVKISDEDTNKKNLNIIRYEPGRDTNNLSKILFLDSGNLENENENKNDINTEIYNTPVRSYNVTGSKVFNDITKKDSMNNNSRISDELFKN